MNTTRVEKITTILGRKTYLFAPASARRVVVYLHGFGGSAATRGPGLARALGDDAGVALVVPQLGPKSEPGDLASRFNAFLAAAQAEMGLPTILPTAGVAHSGGYQALAEALRQVPLQAVGLLDALYGQYDVYRDVALSGRCLIDIYGPTTATLSERLRESTVGQHNVQIKRTSTAHDSIPERYLRDMVQSFNGCTPIVVV